MLVQQVELAAVGILIRGTSLNKIMEAGRHAHSALEKTWKISSETQTGLQINGLECQNENSAGLREFLMVLDQAAVSCFSRV